MELIVVVVIIGILSAIAIPSFQNLKHKADEAEAQLLANSIIKSASIFYLRESRMSSNWVQIASEIPSLSYCTFDYAVNRTCGKASGSMIPVSSINAEVNPMNCIVVTNASYELCGRNNTFGFSLIMREFSYISSPSSRRSISACLGNNGEMKIVKQSSREEAWIDC